jgi:hypothetical protein
VGVGCSLAEESGQEFLSCDYWFSFDMVSSRWSWKLLKGFGAVMPRVWHTIEKCGYAMLSVLIFLFPFSGCSNFESQRRLYVGGFLQDVSQRVIAVVLIPGWQGTLVTVKREISASVAVHWMTSFSWSRQCSSSLRPCHRDFTSL